LDPHKPLVQDRRAAARVNAHLVCQFSFQKHDYEAMIKDISLKGAFLWSAFMPPVGSNVVITVQTPLLASPLVLEATVVRTDCSLNERGTAGSFAVIFNSSPLGLVKLISLLASGSATTKPGQPRDA